MTTKTPGEQWRDEHPEAMSMCCKPHELNLYPCRFAARAIYQDGKSGHSCNSAWPERCQWYCGEPKEE